MAIFLRKIIKYKKVSTNPFSFYTTYLLADQFHLALYISLSAFLFTKIHFSQKEITSANIHTPLIASGEITEYSCAWRNPDINAGCRALVNAAKSGRIKVAKEGLIVLNAESKVEHLRQNRGNEK